MYIFLVLAHVVTVVAIFCTVFQKFVCHFGDFVFWTFNTVHQVAGKSHSCHIDIYCDGP